MKLFFTIKFYFVSFCIVYAQKEIIPLYPEGVKCTNNLPAEIDYDQDGRIFKKVVEP